ncbi:hypothetical protein Tco_1362333 [Tanacetum coccineum]
MSLVYSDIGHQLVYQAEARSVRRLDVWRDIKERVVTGRHASEIYQPSLASSAASKVNVNLWKSAAFECQAEALHRWANRLTQWLHLFSKKEAITLPVDPILYGEILAVALHFNKIRFKLDTKVTTTLIHILEFHIQRQKQVVKDIKRQYFAKPIKELKRDEKSLGDKFVTGSGEKRRGIGGEDIMAVANDVPVAGCKTKTIYLRS